MQIFIYVKFQVLSNFEELQIPGGCKLWELSNFGELGAIKSFSGWAIRFYHSAAKFTELNELKYVHSAFKI
jgi:hypothetical protein